MIIRNKVADGTSVVVVTHNRNEQLLRCLKSLVSQNEKPNEILILDNSSLYSSKPILYKVEAYQIKIKAIHIRNTKKLGYARHLGFKKAKYSTVCFIDDDAYADGNWVKSIQVEFKKNKDLSAIRGRTFTSQPNNYWSNFSQTFEDSFLESTNKKHEVISVIGVNLALSKKICQENKIQFNKSLTGGEDIDISFQIQEKKNKILFVPEAIVFHDYRTSLLAYFKRAFDYVLFDYELKKPRGYPFFFTDYLPKRKLEYILLPLNLPKTFLKKCSNFVSKTEKKWFIGIAVKELATLLGITYIYIRRKLNTSLFA